MIRRPILLVLASLAALLNGCPAASDPPASTIRQLGMVSVGALYNDEGVYEVHGASGLFVLVERPPEGFEAIQDRCFVNDSPPLLPDEAFATLLDAGGFIDIRADGQPFAALARVNFSGGGYGYTAGELGTYPPVPERGLTANVPGAAFPAFKGEFPPPPPPVELVGESVTLTTGGRFTWQPHEVEGGASLVGFQVASPDTGEDPPVLASCVAADDGEFTFPPSVREEIRKLNPNFEGVVFAPGRSVYRLETRGDAALALILGNDDDVFRVLLNL